MHGIFVSQFCESLKKYQKRHLADNLSTWNYHLKTLHYLHYYTSSTKNAANNYVFLMWLSFDGLFCVLLFQSITTTKFQTDILTNKFPCFCRFVLISCQVIFLSKEYVTLPRICYVMLPRFCLSYLLHNVISPQCILLSLFTGALQSLKLQKNRQ